MADFVIPIIVVSLVLLKIGIWICCCYARAKRRSQLNQQRVIIFRPATAVTQTNMMRQWFQDGNGIAANELPTPVTSPQYGFQAEGHASQYTHCTGMTQDKHPTTNSFPWDSFQPQFPIHSPPNYEEALKSGSV